MYAQRRSTALPTVFLILVLALIAGAAIQILRPLPSVGVERTFAESTVLGEQPSLVLPEAGAATVAVRGIGVVGSNNGQTARPIASVAKVMTAYVILRDHPLALGEEGPSVSISQADEARYFEMIAQDQSALPVAAGLQFSQLDLLKGLLVPSANNFAEILAQWDSGSVTAFVEKMNSAASDLGMTQTRYADVSGFSQNTVSSPLDQLALTLETMRDPVFAAIVASSSVDLPHIGTVFSTNELLGANGFVGIKTGFTEEAGGNLAFAARHPVGALQAEILGGVYGQIDRPQAFVEAAGLVQQVVSRLQLATAVRAGQSVAQFQPPWDEPVDIVVDQDASLLVWPGATLTADFEFLPFELPLAAGEEVGKLTLRLGDQELTLPLVVSEDIRKPDILWRLGRF